MKAASLLPVFAVAFFVVMGLAVPVLASNVCGSNSCGGNNTNGKPVVGSFSYTTTTTTFTSVSVTNTQFFYDATNGFQTTMGFSYMIVLLIGPAVLIGGLTRSMAGGIFGATLGITIGSIPPPQGPGLFPLILVPAMCLVMLAVIFFARRGGSGI